MQWVVLTSAMPAKWRKDHLETARALSSIGESAFIMVDEVHMKGHDEADANGGAPMGVKVNVICIRNMCLVDAFILSILLH